MWLAGGFLCDLCEFPAISAVKSFCRRTGYKTVKGRKTAQIFNSAPVRYPFLHGCAAIIREDEISMPR